MHLRHGLVGFVLAQTTDGGTLQRFEISDDHAQISIALTALCLRPTIERIRDISPEGDCQMEVAAETVAEARIEIDKEVRFGSINGYRVTTEVARRTLALRDALLPGSRLFVGLD